MKYIAVFHPSSELYGADRIMVLATKLLKEYTPVIYLPSAGSLKAYIQKEMPNAIVKIVPYMPIISRAMFGLKGATTVVNNYLKFKKQLNIEHQTYNFEFFYTNTLACSFILPMLKKFHKKVFTHVHEILENPKIAAFITAKLAFNYSTTVISVSKAVQNNLHRIIKKRNAKSIVIHNGIAPITTQHTKATDKISFYLFGRIKPEKGQWYLIEALAKIPTQLLANVEFNLVGGTLKGQEHLLTDLKKNIKEKNLTSFINLKGFTNDISKEMANADVCLVPSLMKDPFPTTVLEAMSAGKVVIASNTGGAKEAIDHNTNGYIIPSNTPETFSKTIVNLIQNPNLIKTIGTNAKNTFNTKFTTQVFQTKWQNAFL